MTIDEFVKDFWKKHNHCPYCRAYPIQGAACMICRHRHPGAGGIDNFEPNDEYVRIINREVTE